MLDVCLASISCIKPDCGLVDFIFGCTDDPGELLFLSFITQIDWLLQYFRWCRLCPDYIETQNYGERIASL